MTSAIAGARRPEQIRQTARAGDLTLPADVLTEIGAILAEREAAPS
jgi:aryl-alcohol dehydrogenase-like predicted oxidoreductase